MSVAPSPPGSISPPLNEPELQEVEEDETSTEDEEEEEEAERQPRYDSDGDEIPDVDDIELDNVNNKANCIMTKGDIDRVRFIFGTVSSEGHLQVLELMDEETCMEMMRSYYEVRSTNNHEEKMCFHSLPGLLREAARAGV